MGTEYNQPVALATNSNESNLIKVNYSNFTHIISSAVTEFTTTDDTTLRTEQNLKIYMNGIVALLIIVLGLIGNSLTVIVLTRRTMHSSTNCYLTALAVWDALVLLNTLFLITLPQLSQQFNDDAFPYVVLYIYPFALVSQTATLWITVSFTVERYIAVCHPLKAASMCTIPRARLVISIISVSSFLFNMCRWFEYKVVEELNTDEGNMTKMSYHKTNFGGNYVFQQVYYLWLYLLIMFIIPLSSLAVLNAFLILAVRQSKKQRKDMNVRQSRENNVTIMLVSVVIVFMFCQVPALIFNVAYAVDNDAVYSAHGWKVLSAVRNFMVPFNSAINFILYCAFGQKFRRTFMKTFCYHCFKDEDFNSVAYPQTTVASRQCNSKYRALRGNRGSGYEMNDFISMSTLTHNTLLSKYSPHSSKESSPRHKVLRQKIENGKCFKRNGDLDNDSDLQEILKTPVYTTTRSPSPV